MANFKGGFTFNNEAAKVEVEQQPDGTLVSCMNPVTGEELSGGGIFIKSASGSSFAGAVRQVTVGGANITSMYPSTAGATVEINTYNRYKLRAISTESGIDVPFTKVSETSTAGQYSLTMPNENILLTLYYDD